MLSFRRELGVRVPQRLSDESVGVHVRRLEAYKLLDQVHNAALYSPVLTLEHLSKLFGLPSGPFFRVAFLEARPPFCIHFAQFLIEGRARLRELFGELRARVGEVLEPFFMSRDLPVEDPQLLPKGGNLILDRAKLELKLFNLALVYPLQLSGQEHRTLFQILEFQSLFNVSRKERRIVSS